MIARSVRAAGLYTKTGSATAAISLQTVLAQKYNIKLPYWNGGKSWDLGADFSWGKYKYKYREDWDTKYLYYGLDCSGFTTWAYINAGYDIGFNKYPAYFWGWRYEALDLKKENGDIGDFLVLSDVHVKMIVGKTNNGFIVAEAAYGMMVDIHLYSKPEGYKIEKGELLMETYNKMNASNYPSGF